MFDLPSFEDTKENTKVDERRPLLCKSKSDHDSTPCKNNEREEDTRTNLSKEHSRGWLEDNVWNLELVSKVTLNLNTLYVRRRSR